MTLRQAAPTSSDDREGSAAKRPFVERWWYFFLVTAWAWIRLVDVLVTLARGKAMEASDWLAIAVLALALPAWCWGRRRSERKRNQTPSR